MGSPGYYSWWIQRTTPKHPVLMDRNATVLRQIQSTGRWPNVIVTDCEGKIAFRKGGEMTETVYRQTREAIDRALQSPSCARD